MTIWPEEFAIRNCIAWNAAAREQAERDARNHYAVVPATATKRVYSDGKAMNVRLTVLEYREARRKDALRHEANCVALYARLNERKAA
jgi:hypothetical protein